jgi:signal transduction histidine kinase
VHRDGSYRWLQWSAQSVPGQLLVHATARDVTDQRRLEKEIVEISDREKDRLGRDLHDGLCQKLAGIVALSTTLSRQLASESEPAAAGATEITRLLKQAIIEARNLARGLNPVELDGIGLVGALNTLAANIQSLFKISCTFRCSCPSLRLGSDFETHLYRIAQEAVQNAVKHSRAKRISVTLNLEKGRGALVVLDDGIGIASDVSDGNGLHTMNYRARLIGASLWVRPQRGRGTRVDCVFGLPAASPKKKAS